MSNPDSHALAGAYALDALDDLERASFGRHLAECDPCATEVAELRETAARLADDTWEAPPPGLRAAVLSQVAQTRQLPPGGAGRPEMISPAVVSRWRRVTAAAAVAGIVAAGAGAVSTAIQEERVADQRAVAAAASARADAATTKADRAEAERARMQAVLTAPDVTVRSGTMPTGGRMTMVMSAAQDAGVLVLADAPPPPTGAIYQMWMMDKDDKAVNAGVLAEGERAKTSLVDGVSKMATIGVTIEPPGGSPEPLGTVVGLIPLA